MIRYILILLVLSVTALSQPVMRPRTGEATITFYYPGSNAPETIQVMELFIKIQGSCIAYTHKGDDILYCGTFRLVKAK